MSTRSGRYCAEPGPIAYSGVQASTSFVLALARYPRCIFTRRSPASAGTCPGTLPLSANATEVEEP